MIKMIGVAAPVYDPFGWFVMHNPDGKGSDTAALSRRVTRTATLDGGAVVNDQGYSPADRTIDVQFDADTSEDVVEGIRRLVRLYSSVVLTMADGCFNASPSAFRVTSGKATLTLLISEALAEDY